MTRSAAALLLALAALTFFLLPEAREEEGAVICVLEAGRTDSGVELVDYLPEQEATAEENQHTALVCGILRENAPQAKIYLLRCPTASGHPATTPLPRPSTTQWKNTTPT